MLRIQSTIYLTGQAIGCGSYLEFGACSLEFICDLMLVICYFRFTRVRFNRFINFYDKVL